MVTDQLWALVRRYPMVSYAARHIRGRLPRSLGGVDASRIPPWNRHFTFALPRLESDTRRAGPDSLTLSLPGYLTAPRRLAAWGLARHEPASVSCFMAALDHIGPGAVLDVGSGIGVYAALAAARTRRPVFAFEPTPELASAARAVSVAGDLGFTVEELALSNHNGTAWLKRSRHNDMCNTIVRSARHDLGRIQVRAATLARWNDSAGTFPSFLKIDTAGTEPEVVAGSLEVLRRYRPWTMLKIRPERGAEERLMALLEPLEYTWYPITGEPPYEPRPEVSGLASPAWERMWLFTPEPVPEGYWDSVRQWRRALDACC
ncbi:FkbM family methyltransferase [Nocardiopsis algeriensis]|uniref:FkbM family methyltransferase n=1 Tax=Nocardiopsis algeriensis TaxID=1478215 RepID=A0A841IVL8_9ACTN|nr:FkbM family methyltransferase [Nocardiopsis algeriensis]MBB6120238.1 FkbM family methyltransferase [Nocardiopsis algeriensis]